MFVNPVFHQLNSSISSDFSTLFDSFNLALSHSIDIFAPSITLTNRTYSKSPCFSCYAVHYASIQLWKNLSNKLKIIKSIKLFIK